MKATAKSAPHVDQSINSWPIFDIDSSFTMDINGNFVEDVPPVLMEDDELGENSAVRIIHGENGDSECVPSKQSDVEIGRNHETASSSAPLTPRVSKSPPNSPVKKKIKKYDWESVLGASECRKKCAALNVKVGSQKLKDDQHRAFLAGAVISFELKDDPSASISRARLLFLATEIVNAYPEEKLVDWFETYKDNKGKIVASGRLVYKYYNTRRDYMKCGLLAKNVPKTLDGSASVPSDSSLSAPYDKELEGKLLWLEGNSSDWGTITKYWAETSEYRVRLRQHSKESQTVREYMNKYPALLEPDGHKLIDIGFKTSFKEAHPLGLFEEWKTLREFIISTVKKRNPDFLTDAVYSKAEKILLTLLKFAEVFPVITISTKEKKGKVARRVQESTDEDPNNGKSGKKRRNVWRPSQAAIQDAFLYVSPSFVKIHEHIKNYSEVLYKRGVSVQPFAAVIGPTEKPDEYLVFLDEFSYEVSSPLHAIDIVFKACHTFHVDYPPEAEQVFVFLQHYVYKFDSPYDQHCASARQVGDRYVQFKNNLVKSGVQLSDD